MNDTRSKFDALRLLPIIVLAVMLAGGCSLLNIFGDDEEEEEAEQTELREDPEKPESILEGGVLANINGQAPPNSAAHFLATLAEQFGWEADVTQNTMLAEAIIAQAWVERVEPFMLGLFFRKGFSVLPTVGDGHEFSRDSIVKGPLSQTRYFVTTRAPIRIILLRPANSIVIIYPQDGEQPQLFVMDANSNITVRQSRLAQYLR